MNDIAIKIENLSKQYRLGQVGTGTLSHDLNRWWKMNILGREDPYLRIGETNYRDQKGQTDYVWALKDINLEVARGEVLGIIGKNGAGKSTLLKILSRITRPTTGSITYTGRIASLLEVGTGFHPEMTGRENIYMNGTIMGMTRAEIARKLDEIVDFAGVERYIDTPVKRYSSGMTVRLGFAIAAHLEPEILVVDEVLAVGDAEFQKKAIGKMQDVSTQGGRTVLFVSHNMGAVKQMCNACILLENGELTIKGEPNSIISKYQNNLVSNNGNWVKTSEIHYSIFFDPKSISVVNEKVVTQDELSNDKKIGIFVKGFVKQTNSSFNVGIALFSSDNTLLFWSLNTDKKNGDHLPIAIGENSFIIWIPPHFLNEGTYRVELIASLHFKEWIFQPGHNTPKVFFTIKGGLSDSPFWTLARPGVLAPILTFEKVCSK